MSAWPNTPERAELVSWSLVDDLTPAGEIAIKVAARSARLPGSTPVNLLFGVNPRNFRILRIHAHCGETDWAVMHSAIPPTILDLVETIAREHAPRLLTAPSRRE